VIEMTNCPYCGRELQEGENCTCETAQAMISQTTGNKDSSSEVLNEKQNNENKNVNEEIGNKNNEQTQNISEKERKNIAIASTFNDVINSTVRYCYLTVKFALAFLKNPFVFISKVIQNNDCKVGILFAILTSIFVSIQNLVLAGRGIKLIEDFIGISGLLSSYSSFKTFLYNFIILFLLYLLYCGTIKLAFMIIKESVDFKAILGAVGVSLIPIVWVVLLNLLLQFIAIWLVILIGIFGIITNTILNFWSIRTLSQNKDTTALYITATTYIVCIIVVAIVMFALANGMVGSGGVSTTSFSSNSIIGTWSDDKDTITFYSDGTFKANYYWIGGNWEIDGNKLYLTGFLTGKEGYYYKIEGDRLILEPIPGSGRGKYEFYRVK